PAARGDSRRRWARHPAVLRRRRRSGARAAHGAPGRAHRQLLAARPSRPQDRAAGADPDRLDLQLVQKRAIPAPGLGQGGEPPRRVTMDFGLFYYCQGRGVAHDQAYAEMLDQIALAETLGFGECWFAEHHFTDYSLLPSPNLMIAAALQRTTRMRFGNYVNVLPFHHPLRLAAEAATLDNLARGRFDFGIGKGVRPGEFTKLGLSFDDAPDMAEEAIEILLKLWRQDTASHEGRFWRFPELSLRPRAF